LLPPWGRTFGRNEPFFEHDLKDVGEALHKREIPLTHFAMSIFELKHMVSGVEPLIHKLG